MRTQVVIIGSGPSGLLLGQLLAKEGIDTIILEQKSKDYVLGRIRAGVLEEGAVRLIEQAGAAERLHQQGLIHDGTEIAFDSARHRIDFKGLTGKTVTVYGQTEVTRDLMDGARPSAHRRYTKRWTSVCTPLKAIGLSSTSAGMEPFRRSNATTLPAEMVFTGQPQVHSRGQAQAFERVYPFGWLGVLVDKPPASNELIYVNHERGCALCSMRSTTRSRYYLQCRVDEQVEHWPDDKFWEELARRLDPEAVSKLSTGPSIEKSIAPLRSFVAEPMRFGNLFLAGDAAHIVPPTGAKGLNLAASDVAYLSSVVIDRYRHNSRASLTPMPDARSPAAGSRTVLLVDDADPAPLSAEESGFDQRIQRAELEYLFSSTAAQTALAENYVGLPY